MAKGSSASRSTWFKMDRNVELRVISAIVGNIHGAETLGTGTLLPTMTTLIDITLG